MGVHRIGEGNGWFLLDIDEMVKCNDGGCGAGSNIIWDCFGYVDEAHLAFNGEHLEHRTSIFLCFENDDVCLHSSQLYRARNPNPLFGLHLSLPPFNPSTSCKRSECVFIILPKIRQHFLYFSTRLSQGQRVLETKIISHWYLRFSGYLGS